MINITKPPALEPWPEDLRGLTAEQSRHMLEELVKHPAEVLRKDRRMACFGLPYASESPGEVFQNNIRIWIKLVDEALEIKAVRYTAAAAAQKLDKL